MQVKHTPKLTRKPIQILDQIQAVLLFRRNERSVSRSSSAPGLPKEKAPKYYRGFCLVHSEENPTDAVGSSV
jgi:hypothetical protein